MEDNLHNDKLEEFLNNSFQGYSEEPPGDLWDKIEGGLAPAPLAAPVRSIRWAWWAAAAAVVGGLILGQHFYFSTKLNTLSEQLEQNEALLRDLKEETGAKEPTAPASGSDIQAQIPENQNFEKEKPFRQTQQTNPGSYFLKPNNKSKKPAAAGQKNADNHLQNSATPGTPIAQANNPTASGTELAPLPQADVFEQKNDANGSAQVAAALALPDFLPAKNAWLVADKAPLNLNLPSAIDPVKKPGSFSLGIHAMPMTTWEKITAVRNRMPLPGRKVFNETSTSNGASFYAGLVAEYQTSPRFYMGGGMDYRKTTTTSTHKPEFKLKDGHSHGGLVGGPHDFKRDFQYDLNTAAGLVEIEVRAEQADTSRHFPEDEKIGLRITTQQELEYLSFPVYGRYELGQGKWRFFLKGGLVANFLLSSTFDINDIQSDNDQFRFEKRQQPGGSPQNLQTMSMDYMAGIGVDYALNQHLKLRLEPNFIGSLTSKHNNPNIQSSQYSAGLNAGLLYVF